MKTPHLDEKINLLTGVELSEYGKSLLTEYKAIKQLIEKTPIVSTPNNPVWVVDESGDNRILLAYLGNKVIGDRFILVCPDYEQEFLNGRYFDYVISSQATPYTPKVNIEVTEEEAVKVEEFLKTLRNGN